MNAIRRRVTTTGLLILAALSYGCGSDSPSSVLPMLSTPGTLGATSGAAGAGGPVTPAGSALSLAHSAQKVGGTDVDVDSANSISDALYSVLRGGALQAASPTGGAIADGSAGTQIAAIQVPGDGAPIASDAQQPRLTVATLRSSLAMKQGVPVFTFDGDNLRVQSPDGTDVNLTGVSQLPLDPGQDAPPLGFRLSADVHISGHFGGDASTTGVDLTVRGLTGTISFVRDQDPIIDLTVGEGGVAVSGFVGDIGGSIAASGASGHFTTVRELNQMLAGHTLHVVVTGVHVKDIVTEGRADAQIESLQLPLDGSRPLARVWGGADITFDPKAAFAEDGKIAHAALEVPVDHPLVLDGRYDGPSSGRVIASVHHRDQAGTDVITIEFVEGQPTITGTLTNVTGTPERVQTTGDTTSATGSVRFTDGRLGEHTIEVRQRTGGPRHIVFRVTIRDGNGVQVLALVGTVRADKSLAGNWQRMQTAQPSGPTANASAPALNAAPAAVTAAPIAFSKNGTFRVVAEGTLELVDDAGEVLARGAMPDGWNRGL